MIKHALALTLILALFAPVAQAGEFTVASGETAAAPERTGPPTSYMPSVMRYGERSDPERYYPVPQDPVTRESYYQWLVDSGHFDYMQGANPENHAQYGPRHFMPVLAKFVHDKDRAAGEACVRMLKAFDKWLRENVARTGWNESFIDEPGYIGFYKRYLEPAGLLDPQKDLWFRDMVIYLNQTMHVWGGPEWMWRGPMHRAQGEVAAKRLCLFWYPDIAEAPAWKKYVDEAYNDFWLFRDNPVNDSNYYLQCAMPPIVMAAELTGNQDFFTDPGMKIIWDRLMSEVSPDGAVTPYGAHGGWNHSAAPRIYMLELAARYTRDGRYRFAASKLFNYLRYQQDIYKQHHMLMGPFSTEKIALAYLIADDTLKPVAPDGGSQILYHREMLRVRGKDSGAKYFAQFGQAPLDPDPVKNQIDCAMINTPATKPFKLILRSGWNPGDLFAEVELYPRHDPLNPPGILGLTRWGACLTMPIDAKGSSDENRLLIQDLSGSAPLRFNTDPGLNDQFYQEVEVPFFKDLKEATFVRVAVTNYQGWPVKYHREFLFLKNRFLVTRDIPEFEEGFLAQVAPVFNTQNVGPQIGENYANTFFSGPRGASAVELHNPAVDLLVWFAPQPGCRLQVVDRTASDVRAMDVPTQLRYTWRGLTTKGQKLLFTQVFYPHKAALQLAHSNAPGAARTQDLVGTAGADGIHLLKDSLDLTVFRFTFDPDRVEWLVANPPGAEISASGLATDAEYLYLDTLKGEVKSIAAVNGTFCSLDGKDVYRERERRNYEK